MWGADRHSCAVGRVTCLLTPLPTHRPTPPSPLQAGDLCEELGDTARAVEWFTRLLTKAPHDSGALSRLGALHAK